jgi:CheY-like chemotaxis protein
VSTSCLLRQRVGATTLTVWAILGSGQWLKRDKQSVDWVKIGESALTAMASSPYDTVILDIDLPKMSCLEVLKKRENSTRNTNFDINGSKLFR